MGGRGKVGDIGAGRSDDWAGKSQPAFTSARIGAGGCGISFRLAGAQGRLGLRAAMVRAYTAGHTPQPW